MSSEFKFRATDAFVYVDTYRRAILQPIGRIQNDLARVRERATAGDANLSPTRYYAELRAYEHAFNFVSKRQEPNVVFLGEDEDAEVTDGKGGKVAKSAKQLAKELSVCEEHGETLEISLKQSKAREHELQTELVSRDQLIERINHRLANTQSTITVLTTTLAVTVIVLLMVMFF